MQITGFISRLSFSLFVLLLATSQANARVYKWVDENGETHYGDMVPEKYLGDRQNVRVQPKATQPAAAGATRSNQPGQIFPKLQNTPVVSGDEWEQQRKESEAAQRKAMESGVRLTTQKRPEKKKSYEEQMKEYKASQNCFGAAKGFNSRINMAVANKMGCKDVKRPTRD